LLVDYVVFLVLVGVRVLGVLVILSWLVVSVSIISCVVELVLFVVLCIYVICWLFGDSESLWLFLCYGSMWYLLLLVDIIMGVCL